MQIQAQLETGLNLSMRLKFDKLISKEIYFYLRTIHIIPLKIKMTNSRKLIQLNQSKEGF